MSNILIDFYKKTLESLGLYCTEDGYIKVSKDGDFLVKSAKERIPLVLPTQEHIKTLLEDDNGKAKIVKLPFNPLDENALKGETTSIRKMKIIIEQRITQGIYVAGLLLLKLGENEKVISSPSMNITDFLRRLSKLRNQNVKKLIDDKVISIFDKLYKASKELNVPFFKIHIKKNGLYQGTKYYKLATGKSELYEKLVNGEEFNFKMRNKDKKAAQIVFEYLLGITPEQPFVAYGSNGKYPSFETLMNMYIDIMGKIMSILKELSVVDQELADSLEIELKVTKNDLESLDIYSPYVAAIPSLTDIQTTMHNNEVSKQQVTQQPQQTNNVVSNNVQTQQVQQQVEEDPTRSVINKIMNRSNVAMTPVQQPVYGAPQPIVNQQPVGYPQQPQQVRPVGLNGAIQQAQMSMYNRPQPMYGTPQLQYGMSQQPMYGAPQPVYGGTPQPQYGMPQQSYQRPMGANGFLR